MKVTLLGRNELCPCGSGKKYKKCCMNKDLISERAARKVGLSQKEYTDLYTRLYNYSKQEKFKDEFEKAKEAFFIMDDEEINSKFEVFFNTYFIQDHIMELNNVNKVITVDFFEENKNTLTQVDIDILKSLFESYLSVYEIMDMSSGKVKLKDCLTGDEVTTADVNLLKEFKVGSAIIARPIHVGDTSLLIDITLSISDEVKDLIVNDINKLHNQYESVYKDKKTFLIYHTHILYKYIQQLLDKRVADFLKAERDKALVDEVAVTKNDDASEIKEPSQADCKVTELIKRISDDEISAKCVNFWTEYKNNNMDKIKGSENSWAAAVEYHIKKENGEVATQAEVAKKYDTSASTLGKRYKEIKNA
ncbi:SEC-C domain-containing protein [Metaclostridioides mangenotii]|uniref:SEC-C domain-containing protein n=1 Tax=Metaclostridioides mangenotii TaxID=1540 RepID=UPI0028E29D90|nr:SEC-C metal-binding domain-containing protein [Clostridioides mangenotii]